MKSKYIRTAVSLEQKNLREIEEIMERIDSPSKSHSVRKAISEYLKQLQKEAS